MGSVSQRRVDRRALLRGVNVTGNDFLLQRAAVKSRQLYYSALSGTFTIHFILSYNKARPYSVTCNYSVNINLTHRFLVTN